MPIYEYLCSACNAKTEEMQSMNDKPLTKCSDCGGEVKRIISQSSFHLKGTGWYKTDYASKETRDSKEKEKKDTPPQKPADCANCPGASAACSS